MRESTPPYTIAERMMPINHSSKKFPMLADMVGTAHCNVIGQSSSKTNAEFDEHLK